MKFVGMEILNLHEQFSLTEQYSMFNLNWYCNIQALNTNNEQTFKIELPLTYQEKTTQ